MLGPPRSARRRTDVDARPTSAGRAGRSLLAVGLLLAVAVAVVLSVVLGSGPIGPSRAFEAILHPSRHPDEIAVLEQLRFPRTGVAVAIGAALGASGVLLRALTRNPVADPSILGISAGASLAVVLAISLLDVSGSAAYTPFSLVGGATAGVIAWVLAGGARGGTVGLALAGAALTALCAAGTQALTVLDAASLDQFRFWLVGSVAGRSWSTLLGAAPVLVAGAVVAVLVAPALNTLALGDDTARGLGQDVGRVRLAAGVAALLLASGAVAVAGPIALIGLVAAHVAALLAGSDVRWQLAVATLLGVVFLVGGDVVGRIVVPPREIAVGVVSPMVGVPVFLWLVARRRVAA